jgi:hypothetical protein
MKERSPQDPVQAAYLHLGQVPAMQASRRRAWKLEQSIKLDVFCHFNASDIVLKLSHFGAFLFVLYAIARFLYPHFIPDC